MGISFQIREDWLDSFGSIEKMGKQPGSDIIRNKKTFLFLKALSISDDSTRQQLKWWFSEGQQQSDEKVSAILEIYSNLGISAITQDIMESNVAIAMQHLRDVSLEDRKKYLLADLCKKLLHRNE